MTILRESLHLAERGYRQIPCVGKVPILDDWPNNASRDPDVLRGWFGEEDRKPLEERKLDAILTGETIAIIDADTRDDARRLFSALRNRIRSILLTPRGGAHFAFRTDGLHIPNAVKTTIEGIQCDIRGYHGCALTIGPGREFVEGFELPEPRKLEPFDRKWIQQELKRRIETTQDDTLHRIYRATRWADKVEGAVEHQGWHNRIFWFMCQLRDKFGLTLEQAYPLILMFNAKCKPPICNRGLKHKTEDVWGK